MTKKIKRALCVCLSLCLALGCLSPAALAAVPGDTDGADGVTAADARTILRAAVGLDTLSGEALAAADVNTDGEITASDARLALRVAVGLELPAARTYENQYDILRSGDYCAELASGADGVSMTVAAHGGRRWISTTMEGVEISFLSDGTALYLLDAPHRIYAAFDEAAAAFLGDDAGMDTFLGALDVIEFSGLPSLDAAAFTLEETVDGIPCTAYLIAQGDGFVKVWMDGVRILAFARLDARGRISETLRFASVRGVVPAEPMTAPENYLEIPDLMTFMLIAFSGALGAEPLSDEEIRALIEEARAGL